MRPSLALTYILTASLLSALTTTTADKGECMDKAL